MADKLQGTWVFDPDKIVKIAPSGSVTISWDINFISNGKPFISLVMTGDYTGFHLTAKTRSLTYVAEVTEDSVFVIRPGQTDYTQYMTIEIISKYDEVENADELLTALQARASFTPNTADAIQVPMISAKGVLLNTQGKLCEKEIMVTPQLEEISITENGEYTPSKVGYSKVSVNVVTESTPPNIQPLNVTENGTYTAQDGVDGYSPITVEVAASGGGDNFPIGDGYTHIWITLGEGRTSPKLGVCPNGTVTVDWGDGTEPNVLTGTSLTSTRWAPSGTTGDNHNYPSDGDYIITLRVDGEMALTGDNNDTSGGKILRHLAGDAGQNHAYKGAIRKVEIGNTTIIGENAFRASYSLESVRISNGVTSIGKSAFYACYGLKFIDIADGVTSIDSYAFNRCHSLTSVKFPSSVMSIGSWAFGTCYGVAFYDFTKHTAVPTIGTSIFSSFSSDCEIRVPAALYDEWIAATNWANYASNIVAV